MENLDCIKQFSKEQISFLVTREYVTAEELKQMLLCEIGAEKLLNKNDLEMFLSLDSEH